MKKLMFISFAAMLLLNSCRLADFTVLSTKNYDTNGKYVLLQAHSHAGAFQLKNAVDKAIDKASGGVFMTNVVIKQGLFGHFGVTGDVWGPAK